jgi:hypothetical protein
MAKPKITKKQIDHTLAFTDDVVKNYPDRLIGTPSAKAAAKRIAEEFEKSCDPGTVKIEPFTCHPRAFLKWIRPSVLIYIGSTMANLLKKPKWALSGFGFATSMFVSQFAFYKEFFDPLYPKEVGYNVYGVLEPEDEVKQQIIICGHHDAAYVFHYLAKSVKLYPLFLVAGIVPFIFGLFSTLYMVAFRKSPRWIRTVLAACTAGVIPLWWFTTEKISPAAGDNMIATSVANEAVKLFADQKKKGKGKSPLKHTRLIALSVDGEECGLRGSRAYAKMHEKEMKDTKTYAFCIDTLYNKDKLVFFNNDLNLTVDLSDAMAQDLKEIATSLGYKSKVAKMPWGGGSTDAASFGQVGIDASCMLALEMDPRKLEQALVYHTSKDTTDAIEPEAVEQALNVVHEYILKKDSEVCG